MPKKYSGTAKERATAAQKTRRDTLKDAGYTEVKFWLDQDQYQRFKKQSTRHGGNVSAAMAGVVLLEQASLSQENEG